MEQEQVPFILAMTDDSESISKKKKSHKLAESLRCHLINESVIIRTLHKTYHRSSSGPYVMDEFECDLSFELLSEIAFTQLGLKLNVIVNMLFLNDARRKRFEELVGSKSARLIILQEETGSPQNIRYDRYVMQVSTENGSFDVNEISAKIFHFLSTTKKDDAVTTESQKPKKEPTNDHLHELILAKEPRKMEIHCSSCSEPVSGLSYACAECDQFTFHKSCAESTKVTQACPLFFLEDRPKQYNFENTNKCHNCDEFTDRCYDCLLQTNFTNGFLPAIVHDEKHDHFLNLIIMPFEINYRYICGICDKWGGAIGYKCYDCCYDVHVRCITGENGRSPYFLILNCLFNVVLIDNMEILKALIYAKDDQLPLYDGYHKKRVSLEVLRRKNVLLYISDLELPHEELSMLDQIYSEARANPSRAENQYEVVWLPVVDRSTLWNEAKQKQFEALQSMMTWHSVYHPSLLDPAVIKYIKEVWRFIKKPLLVVLDPQGKVVNPNAINMMWIWGNAASFPFTTSREKALWDSETWRLELLVDGIDPLVLDWSKEGRYICLYGGDDLDWIRKFTTTTRAVAQAARVPLEMVYIGKRNSEEKVRTRIEEEALSYCWHDFSMIWFFWKRVESMIQSKNQLGQTTDQYDPIMKQIMTLLSFDASGDEWALFGGGSEEIMIQAEGDVILTCLIDYDYWKDGKLGFLRTLQDYIDEKRNIMSGTDHIDEMRILKPLFYAKDDQLPLYDGYRKRRISLKVLWRKTVLLYISDLEPSQEEFIVLEILNGLARKLPSWIKSQFEIVWVPVVDPSTPWNETKQQQFETVQSMMPWYSVNHPSLLHPAAIKYIKEVWQFNKKPLLVAIDPEGNVVNPNAINMIYIWGDIAFPFTTSREKALWELETWRFELLVDGIDPLVLDWSKEGRYICLYGGDDLDWIRKFTTTTRAVARDAQVPLEMVYIGKRNSEGMVRRNLQVIMREKLSYCWNDLTVIWFFWKRIESMVQSKNQLGQTTDQNDPIMKQIMTLLNFDASGDEWALFGGGGSEEIMIQAEGDVILTCLKDYNHWKDEILDKGFLPTLEDQILRFEARNQHKR